MMGARERPVAYVHFRIGAAVHSQRGLARGRGEARPALEGRVGPGRMLARASYGWWCAQEARAENAVAERERVVFCALMPSAV